MICSIIDRQYENKCIISKLLSQPTPTTVAQKAKGLISYHIDITDYFKDSCLYTSHIAVVFSKLQKQAGKH